MLYNSIYIFFVSIKTMPFSRYNSDTEQESPETKYWRQAKNKSKLTVNEGKVYGCDSNSACMDAYDKMYDHYDRKQVYLNNQFQPRIDTRQTNPKYIYQDFSYPTRNVLFDHSFNSQTTPGNIDNYVREYDDNNMPNENRIFQRFKKSNYNNIQPNTPVDLFMPHKVAINPLYSGNYNTGIVSNFVNDSQSKKTYNVSDYESFIRIILFIVIAVYFSILIIKSCRIDSHSNTSTNTTPAIPVPPGLPDMLK